MENATILKLLVSQRDRLYDNLKGLTISGLYKEQYEDIKAGRIFVFDSGERHMLDDLAKLANDKSLDKLYQEKLQEYLQFDNNQLISYFQNELEKVFTQVKSSGKQDEIQAMFIEYDFYYHYTSYILGYGRQDYPLIEEPRYISQEFDYTKQVLLLPDGINFKPAWVSCEAISNLDYLEISTQLEHLFKLHSRVLVHQALDRLHSEGQLDFLSTRPFTFYINEHDCEVMMLYRLN